MPDIQASVPWRAHQYRYSQNTKGQAISVDQSVILQFPGQQINNQMCDTATNNSPLSEQREIGERDLQNN